MIASVVGTAIIILIYVCLAIIVFSPTIFAGWFYLVARRITRGKAPVPTSLVTTLVVNVLVVLVVGCLAFDHFVTGLVTENDALAEKTLRIAVQCQQEFHVRRGRYYSVGPVRGPYKTADGLEVAKDVILQMRASWEEGTGKDDTFEAYAVHVFGRGVYFNTKGGEIHKEPDASEKAKTIRGRLIRSVK